MTTLNLQIGASTDDAVELPTGTMRLNLSTLQNSNVNAWIGLRFASVTIPNSATINSATLTGEMIGTARDDPAFDIYCEDADSPGTFLGSSGNISGRTLTTASATITATNVGAGPYTFPDMASVIQEVVDRAGWASGNALIVILDGITGGDSEFDSWDGAPSTAFKLDIDYTASGTAVAGQLINSQPLKTKVGGALTS